MTTTSPIHHMPRRTKTQLPFLPFSFLFCVPGWCAQISIEYIPIHLRISDKYTTPYDPSELHSLTSRQVTSEKGIDQDQASTQYSVRLETPAPVFAITHGGKAVPPHNP